MILHFIILLTFAHMLADYVFQWQGLVDRKKEGQFTAFAAHILIFFLLAFILTCAWAGGTWIVCILILTGLHAVQDVMKIWVQKKRSEMSFFLEVGDVLLHLTFIIVIAVIFFPTFTFCNSVNIAVELSSNVLTIKSALLGASLAFLLKGGTSIIRSLLDQIGKSPTKQMNAIGFISKMDSVNGDESSSVEYNVGRIIGNLERILLFIFVVLNNYAAIGFVIAAKSVARFKNLEDHNFAEYYLVGTLVSCLIAIIVGLIAVIIFKMM